MADSKRNPRVTRSRPALHDDEVDEDSTPATGPATPTILSSDRATPDRGRSLHHSHLDSPSVHDALSKQDARQRFDTLAKKYHELKEKYNELHEHVAGLEVKYNEVNDELFVQHSELNESNLRGDRAAEERDEAIAHLRLAKERETAAVNARNEIAFQLVQSGTNRQSSAPIEEAVPRVQKSTKMPDALMLCDG
jgi:hypothetical protein